MTIKAKYDGKCRRCGGKINAGEEIYYQNGKGAWHVDCTKAIKQQEEKEKNEFWLVGASYVGLEKGTTIRTTKNEQKNLNYPEFVTVEEYQQQYIHEDGMSFGCYGEEGWIGRARCRKATEEEVEGLLKKEEEREQRRLEVKAAEDEMKEIKKEIQETGEKPEGMNEIKGERVYIEGESSIAYGGGTWFVIEQDYIWFVQNNGADGDDWGYNNVHTGGAGAIGRRIPYKQEIVDRLEKAAQVLGL